MRTNKLTKYEQAIETRLDEYIPMKRSEYQAIGEAIAARRKDAVLHIRINRQDLEHIKLKAKKMGTKYQTFISEILHKVAQL